MSSWLRAVDPVTRHSGPIPLEHVQMHWWCVCVLTQRKHSHTNNYCSHLIDVHMQMHYCQNELCAHPCTFNAIIFNIKISCVLDPEHWCFPERCGLCSRLPPVPLFHPRTTQDPSWELSTGKIASIDDWNLLEANRGRLVLSLHSFVLWWNEDSQFGQQKRQMSQFPHFKVVST